MKNLKFKFLLVSVLGLALSACGGGGSDSSYSGNTVGTGGTGGTGGVSTGPVVATCPELTNPGVNYTGGTTTGEVVEYEISADNLAYRYTFKKSLDTTRQNAFYCGTLSVNAQGDYSMSEFSSSAGIGLANPLISPVVRKSSLTGAPVIIAAVRGATVANPIPFVGFKFLASALPFRGQYALLGNETTGTTNALFNATVDFAGASNAPALCTNLVTSCANAATVTKGSLLNTFNLNNGVMLIGQVAGKNIPLFMSNATDGSGLRVGFPLALIDSTVTNGTYSSNKLNGTAKTVALAGNGFTVNGTLLGSIVANSPVNGLNTFGTVTFGADNTTGLAVFSDTNGPDVLFGLKR